MRQPEAFIFVLKYYFSPGDKFMACLMYHVIADIPYHPREVTEIMNSSFTAMASVENRSREALSLRIAHWTPHLLRFSNSYHSVCSTLRVPFIFLWEAAGIRIKVKFPLSVVRRESILPLSVHIIAIVLKSAEPKANFPIFHTPSLVGVSADGTQDLPIFPRKHIKIAAWLSWEWRLPIRLTVSSYQLIVDKAVWELFTVWIWFGQCSWLNPCSMLSCNNHSWNVFVPSRSEQLEEAPPPPPPPNTN